MIAHCDRAHTELSLSNDRSGAVNNPLSPEKMVKVISFIGGLLVLELFVGTIAGFTGTAEPGKTKPNPEAGGFIVEKSRDVILSKARAEGKLRVLSSFSGEAFRRMRELMRKKYPFIDTLVEEITGPDAQQRLLLELKSGTVKDWDVVAATPDMYNDFVPERKRFDILGMAQQGVLAINARMVDPENRGVVALGSNLCSIAYNKNLISPEKVPNTWEDFLKPEFKGKKFILDIRPTCLAGLTVGFGEQWLVDYAKKLAAQDPVWARGFPVAMTRIAAGEYALHQLTNYNSCMRAAAKDAAGSLVCKIIQPTPVRLMNTEFVIRTASHPYAALLWIEMEASPEGQKVLDEHGPLNSSIYAQGKIAEAVKGLTVFVNDFKTLKNTTKWQDMAVAAFGFPSAHLK
jgi:ABC-type Fe3+ transport system substrate-binding protein